MNRTRNLTAGAVGTLLVVAATSFASPWWTLNRLRAAVERHDAEGVSAEVDFPALRDSVKSQLLGSIARDAGTNAFAAIGQAFARAVADPLVDAIVSPAGVAAMVEHGKVSIAKPTRDAGTPDAEPPRDKPPQHKPPQHKPHYALHYRGWRHFAVTAEDGGSFVFRRAGLWSWKLAGIELPRN
ncbi:hypothetical protein ASD28_15080 [Massilia sp. Root133]|uniref:DUF2939 domain-containing protein n=1 Tax=unclassified Massilia TaxID=2609279 RepID=UPI0007127017|nr:MULTISPECIES: DUF2939 domain-containing protein [unclassified Massilia]KQX98413.1 hypothetical protein ASD28_15080 [Massilia sp. Root133]KQZ47098.1 hypothetical protein ASD92_24970 [Massilia sp. Root1485]